MPFLTHVRDGPHAAASFTPAPIEIKRNPTCASVISVDAKGVIEYWPNDGSDGLPAGLGFRYKTETHLYELAKCKVS